MFVFLLHEAVYVFLGPLLSDEGPIVYPHLIYPSVHMSGIFFKYNSLDYSDFLHDAWGQSSTIERVGFLGKFFFGHIWAKGVKKKKTLYFDFPENSKK